MSRAQEFYEKMKPYAERAASQTGLSVEFILTQWAHESAYGSSNFAVNHNNYGGLKVGSQASPEVYEVNGHAGYPTISDFVNDYIRIINLPFYSGIRDADNIMREISESHDSPYATDPNYGSKMERIYKSFKGIFGSPVMGGLGEYRNQAEQMNESDLIKYGALGLFMVAVVKSFD